MTPRLTAVLGGHPDELALVGGLLALARAYLGNDSGPAHLAQAFGTPGVVVFGGGGRPASYACWGAGSIGMVHPLPCFGCAWDCLLGHGLCVESVSVPAVAEAMNEVLDDPTRGPKTIVVDTLDQPMKALLTAANGRYREVQADRERRIAIIIAMDARIDVLEDAAAKRLQALERINAEAERRAQLIDDLTRAVADRERIAAERLQLLEANQAEAARCGKSSKS